MANQKAALMASALILSGSLGLNPAAIAQTEASSTEDTACNLHDLENSFETESFWVYICREEDELFYTRIGKTTAGDFVRLPATKTSSGNYIARDVSTYHQINSERLDVWKQGQRIITEPVINAYLESAPDLSEIPEAVLQGCRQRVLTELESNEDEIAITNAQSLGGTYYSVFWRLSDGTLRGSCQVEKNGSVIAFSSDPN